MIRNILVLLVLLMSFPAVYASEEHVSKEKKQNIIELMELTGALDIGLQFSKIMNAQLTSILAKNNPDIPKEKYVIVGQVVNSVIEKNIRSENGFLNKLIPIYDKYFTNEDLRILLAFYQSDTGKKIIKALPNIMQESMAAGQEWGKSLVPIFLEQLKSKFKTQGYELSI